MNNPEKKYASLLIALARQLMLDSTAIVRVEIKGHKARCYANKQQVAVTYVPSDQPNAAGTYKALCSVVVNKLMVRVSQDLALLKKARSADVNSGALAQSLKWQVAKLLGEEPPGEDR